jgi:Tol biopolymer transport system component
MTRANAVWLRGFLATTILLSLVGCMATSDLAGPGIKKLDLPATIRLTFHPALDPTGTRVAFDGFISQTEGSIYVWDQANGTASPTLPSQYFGNSPKWSPDGKSILFSGALLAQMDKGGIWVLHDDSSVNFVTAGAEAAWSPDGSKLAVLVTTKQSDHIDLLDSSTRLSKTIYSIQPPAFSPVSDIAWSPDATALAFTVPTKVNGYRVDYLYRIKSDGTDAKILVADSQLRSASDPKWILGGRWVAFLLGGDASDLTLAFVSADGRCVLSPFKNLRGLHSMDFLQNGTKAVVGTLRDLYLLDTSAALAPSSMTSTLVCP